VRGTENLQIRRDGDAVILAVKVVPGSSRDRVVGVLGASLKIATSATPEKGKANAAVAGTLAGALGVARRSVSLVSGQTSPQKEFRVEGLSEEQLRAILASI